MSIETPEHHPTEADGFAATQQAVWLRAYVEKLLRESSGTEWHADDDGDFPFRWGSAACWVSVRELPYLHVYVFAHAAYGLKPTAAVLRELNQQNAALMGGRSYLTAGTVMVEQTVLLEALNAATLQQSCGQVATAADGVGALMAAVHAGQTPYPEEDARLATEDDSDSENRDAA